MIRAVLLLLVLLCLAACDPTRNIVIENGSSQTINVERFLTEDGGVMRTDVVSVPAGRRVLLGAAGVASHALLRKVALMDADCAFIDSEILSDGHLPDAVLITVGADLIVEVKNQSGVDPGTEAVVTDDCVGIIEAP